MKKLIIIFVTSLIALFSWSSFAHDKSGRLEVDCSQKFSMTSEHSQIIVSPSESNLREHGIIGDSDCQYCSLEMIAEFTKANGKDVKHAGGIMYSVKDGKFTLMNNFWNVETVRTDDEIASMKEETGKDISVICHIIY